LKVSSTEDGYLVTSGLGNSPKRWVEVEPMNFREVDGPDILFFRQDEGGRVKYLFSSAIPPVAFERLSLIETRPFQIILLVISGLLFLSCLILWPIGALRNYRRGERAATLP